MKRILIISIFVATSVVYSLRNQIRIIWLKNQPIKYSTVELITTGQEGYFTVALYDTRRRFCNHSMTRLNSLFSDEIMVIRIPLRMVEFNHKILMPAGRGYIHDHADLYFNTVFFDENFYPTSACIQNNKKLGRFKNKKAVISISPEGHLSLLKNHQPGRYSDLLEAPFILSRHNKQGRPFNTLNFRQFICIKNNELIYISGKGNSLICWKDVQAVMQKEGVNSVIALDGGASLHYSFKGKSHTYRFSSVPFRNLWFEKNSPYYMEGICKK